MSIEQHVTVGGTDSKPTPELQCRIGGGLKGAFIFLLFYAIGATFKTFWGEFFGSTNIY